MKTKEEFNLAMSLMAKEAEQSGFIFIAATIYPDGNYSQSFSGEKLYLIGLSGLLDYEIKVKTKGI